MATNADPFKAAGAAPASDPTKTGGEGAAPKAGEGTSEGGEGTDDTKAPTGGVGQGEGSDEAEGEEFATARPDHIPEKFWDKKAGKLNEEGILKSYTELEKALAKAKEPPKAPEKYEFKVNEKLTKDFGLKELKSDDPYVVGFSEFAKSKGYTQEQAQDFVDWYLGMELGQAHKDMVTEFGKLGNQETAVKRVKNLNTFAASKLTPEQAATMQSLAKTKDAIELFEALIQNNTKKRNTVDEDTTIDGQLSEQEVNDMMKDERYHDQKHPEHLSFVAKVTKEFERLYPEKKR